MTRLFSLLLLVATSTSLLIAQGEVPIPLNEPLGNPDWNFRGSMNGNRVFETFRNHGEIGYWNPQRGAQDDSDWPAGGEANPYSDGIAIVVGASVLDNAGNRVRMVSAHFREEVDRSADLETIWGWHPVPDYLNFNRAPNATPAMSNDATSWPPFGWPDQPSYVDENGNVEWNGRFGRGKFNAQLEAYYIMDDGVDYEFNYTPDPSNPDRGGLGLRVATRHFQWVHPLAQDAIFGEFTITNVSDKDLDSTGYGWYVDNGIGGSGSDNGTFVFAEGGIRDLDLAVAFDPTGEVGIWGGPAGLAGYAYLESPGIPSDGVDNDLDGLLDERRDNDAGMFIEDSLTGPNGTPIDVERFIEWYGRPPAPHWEGDEDHDWQPYSDDNGSGAWEDPELINDDVGTDGVGPTDLNYFGPDLDGTEANGRPNQGEPNFGRIDNDESDQLGMTFFEMRPVAPHPNPQPNRFQPMWFSDDDAWWNWLSADSIAPTPQTSVNLTMTFASGTFPLEAGRTERFSMLVGRSPGSETDFSRMIDLKEVVQAIFNTDYQFAQPPIKPTLRAVAGDGKVTLMWDRISLLSREPFYGANTFDFSGYRIYKATDPLFQEITIVTDGDGTPNLKKPLKIFDLDDGYDDFHPIPVNNSLFDMGTESGLEFSYIDEDVLNGVTYYYAVTAFDTGSVSRNLGPSENTTVIETDNIGQVLFTDRNTAAVTPRAPAAGYQTSYIEGNLSQITSGVGDGAIVGIDIISPNALDENSVYQVWFESDVMSRSRQHFTTTYRIDKTQSDGTIVEVIPEENFTDDSLGVFTTILIDGMVITFQNAFAALRHEASGWVEGDGITNERNGLTVSVRPDTGRGVHLVPQPDIEIRFATENISTTERGRGAGDWINGIQVPFEVVVSSDSTVLPASIEDIDGDGVFQLEHDAIQVWESVEGRSQVYWVVTFEASGDFDDPAEGDVIQIATWDEFASGDYFEFNTRAVSVDADAASTALKNKEVAAVPNPFIFTSPLDPSDFSRLGQESRIMFINMPARSTLRIFTLSGKLVRTLDINNHADDGRAMWDLKNSEGLEVAPGIYVFHVTDEDTRKEQIGRLAIIR